MTSTTTYAVTGMTCAPLRAGRHRRGLRDPRRPRRRHRARRRRHLDGPGRQRRAARRWTPCATPSTRRATSWSVRREAGRDARRVRRRADGGLRRRARPRQRGRAGRGRKPARARRPTSRRRARRRRRAAHDEDAAHDAAGADTARALRRRRRLAAAPRQRHREPPATRCRSAFTVDRTGRRPRDRLRAHPHQGAAPDRRAPRPRRRSSTCTRSAPPTAPGRCRSTCPAGGELPGLRRLPPRRPRPPLTLGADLLGPRRLRAAALPAASRTTTTVDGYAVTLAGTPVAGRESELTSCGQPRRRARHRPAALPRRVRPPGRAARRRPRLPAHAPGRARRARASTGGPDVTFGTTFPTAGSYRLFLDFRVGGDGAHRGVHGRGRWRRQ